MLRDRHEPLDLFALVPALEMVPGPVLAQLDTLLDDDTRFQLVKADLAKRRLSTPVEVVLRMLVVEHLCGWSYAQTEHRAADSLVLRQCCRVYTERVPDDTTLLNRANLMQPATPRALLDHIVGLAQRLKVARGRKLRVAGTVVETTPGRDIQTREAWTQRSIPRLSRVGLGPGRLQHSPRATGNASRRCGARAIQ